MADAFGNYTAAVNSATTAPTVGNASGVHGHGAPDATVPSWARIYVNDDTGATYSRSDAGWVLVGP